jgi:hypothetical protein
MSCIAMSNVLVTRATLGGSKAPKAAPKKVTPGTKAGSLNGDRNDPSITRRLYRARAPVPSHATRIENKHEHEHSTDALVFRRTKSESPRVCLCELC